MTWLGRVVHLLWGGHRQRPWAIDLAGNPVGCKSCVKAGIMRAVRREPRGSR